MLSRLFWSVVDSLAVLIMDRAVVPERRRVLTLGVSKAKFTRRSCDMAVIAIPSLLFLQAFLSRFIRFVRVSAGRPLFPSLVIGRA